MTKQRNFKLKVREMAKRTGRSYAATRALLITAQSAEKKQGDREVRGRSNLVRDGALDECLGSSSEATELAEDLIRVATPPLAANRRDAMRVVVEKQLVSIFG